MVQFRSANLRDVVSRPAVTRKPIYAPVENAFRSDTRKRIEQLNDFMQARASNQAGASAPTPSVRGEIWADTSTAGAVTLYVDPDGEGFDDNIATRLTAKAISFKTGGTATFKPGGAIDVNTTQVSQGSSDADLMTYTVPGGTLNADQGILRIIAFGTYASNGLARFAFGATEISTPAQTTNSTDWFAHTLVIRTGPTSQKIFGMSKINLDGEAATTLVRQASASETLASNIVSKFKRYNGTVTQEIMLTRYLP